MKNKGLIATIVVMSAVIITLIVVLIVTQMSSIIQLSELTKKTTVATTEQTSAIIETTEVIETTESIKEEKVKTSIKTYTSHKDRINIEYPVIEGMNDLSMQEKINNKLYINAISIVKLYPISTALQRLNITCNVKYINDDYITVLYEGRVVGDSASGNNVNRKGTTTNSAKVPQTPVMPINPYDPYLDGFIDPLGNGAATQHVIVDPEPVTVIDNNNATTKVQVDKNDNAGTFDGGPTVSKPITPTSPRDANAGLHSTGGIISNGVINGEVSSNGVYNNPKSQGSNVPIYGNSKTDSEDIEVSAHTSTAASTVDHKIFYTNTIDLHTGIDVTLKDYVKDMTALAKYARSNNVEFVNIDEANRTEVIKYIRKTVQSKLAEYLNKYSDFRNEGVKNWPKHFSYRDEDGTVYFTIRLSSKLGNYAIIKYKK